MAAGTERFKRLGKTQRDAFDIAVGQHAVKERVVETLPGDLHTQLVADGEVAGRQPPRASSAGLFGASAPDCRSERQLE